MVTLKSILVDVDVAAAEQAALEQAVHLARRCGARVKVVDVLPTVPAGVRHFVTPALEAELIDHRRERLAALSAAVGDVPVTTELLRGRPGSALTMEVVQSGHDLLVRSHGRARPGALPFGAIDMELLRRCPCPVWVSGLRATSSGGLRVLAAVHANPDDAAEQALNASILEWALTLRELGAGHLTVLQAWLPYGASLLEPRMSRDAFARFVESTRDVEQDALTRLAAGFADRLAGVPLELARGEADDVVAEFVEAHDIDVVVMGTVARTGLAGLIMGNTAERVLRRLRGSVLAVKPPGFASPIGHGREA
jgi:nucleotide-binding universal stress UspA family protein